MISVRILSCGIAFLCALCGATLALSMTELHADGPYTQSATGMTYPVAVGDFQRVKIIRYKDDGSDESAGYNLETPTNEISMTVYVFSSPSLTSFGSPQDVINDARAHLCTAQFHAIQQEILSAHPDAILSGQGDTTLIQGAATHAGYKASYTLTNQSFFGHANVASRSDVYVFCYAGGKWTVEYRVDYPVDYDASEPIANFMRDLTWTISPEN